MFSRVVSSPVMTAVRMRQPSQVVASSCTIITSSSWLVDLHEALPSQHQNHHLKQQQQQIRSVHSERQVKRLFKNHPARQRVEQRKGVDRTPIPLDPPTFPPIANPQFLPNGWSALPDPADLGLEELPKYPFHVARTGNKPNGAVGFLPVYSDFRLNGYKVTTRVKKISGDRDLFLQELRATLQLPEPKNKNPRYDPIRIRAGGTIEIKGNHVREVKKWLAGLGF
mmetsp:Transcript_28480/g.40088  ORF Transcript_28480/g.40088 Transcript_28480/m.40088 type:complete len:225 (+) Transcript_28480:166-840(+)